MWAQESLHVLAWRATAPTAQRTRRLDVHCVDCLDVHCVDCVDVHCVDIADARARFRDSAPTLARDSRKSALCK